MTDERVTVHDLAPGDVVVFVGNRDDRDRYTMTRGTVYLTIPEADTILLTDVTMTGHAPDGTEMVRTSVSRTSIVRNEMEIFRVKAGKG